MVMSLSFRYIGDEDNMNGCVSGRCDVNYVRRSSGEWVLQWRTDHNDHHKNGGLSIEYTMHKTFYCAGLILVDAAGLGFRWGCCKGRRLSTVGDYDFQIKLYVWTRVMYFHFSL